MSIIRPCIKQGRFFFVAEADGFNSYRAGVEQYCLDILKRKN
ncbi:hypothetical protein [Enterococcus mediterraneensis]|nr:hypothetical protein [Enterococcus mediterraneensis]